MALNKEQIGEIAFIVLMHKMEREGFRLQPESIKRDILEGAKKLDLRPSDAAEFAQIMIRGAFEKTMAALDQISVPSRKS